METEEGFGIAEEFWVLGLGLGLGLSNVEWNHGNEETRLVDMSAKNTAVYCPVSIRKLFCFFFSPVICFYQNFLSFLFFDIKRNKT